MSNPATTVPVDCCNTQSLDVLLPAAAQLYCGERRAGSNPDYP